MEDDLDYKKINNYLKEKLEDGSDIVRCLYYEMKIVLNVSGKNENLYLRYVRGKLEEYGYDCYFTNAKYKYGNREEIVKSNEAIVAIRNQF